MNTMNISKTLFNNSIYHLEFKTDWSQKSWEQCIQKKNNFRVNSKKYKKFLNILGSLNYYVCCG